MTLGPNFNQDSLHPHSLGMRVMLSAFLVLFIFTLVIVAILDHKNRSDVIDKYTEQLELQVFNLLAISELEEGEIQIASFFHDDRLNSRENDLIAMIFNENEDRIWDSFSAKKTQFKSIAKGELGKAHSSFARSKNGERYLLQSLSVIWNDDKNPQALSFVMGLNRKVYASQLSSYRKSLFIASLLVIVGVLILQGIILFFGFQSLNTITLDLKKISFGHKTQLDGRYPRELQSVSHAINQLINNEREQKERYQKSLADLAHSLKTPLTVLQSYSENLSNKSIFSEQIERIDQIISYQLQRASHLGKVLASDPVTINTVISEINSALEKVYREKGVVLKFNIAKGSQFYGDKNDLMELLGNLLDNAYKHCKKNLLVSVKFRQKKNLHTLDLLIEDDGAGIAEEDRDFILQRGARVDSLNPGQGIGLAVVVDIVNSYQGNISVKESKLGGACFHLHFKHTFI